MTELSEAELRLKIEQAGDPVLREMPRPLTPSEIASDETQRKPLAFRGVINPKILTMAKEEAEFHEGCLSLAGFSALVPRVRTIQVQCLNNAGKHG